MTEQDHVRVLRVIEYSGPREKVEDCVARSLHGEKRLLSGLVIRAATVGAYPEVLENLSEVCPGCQHPKHGPHCGVSLQDDGFKPIARCGCTYDSSPGPKGFSSFQQFSDYVDRSIAGRPLHHRCSTCNHEYAIHESKAPYRCLASSGHERYAGPPAEDCQCKAFVPLPEESKA